MNARRLFIFCLLIPVIKYKCQDPHAINYSSRDGLPSDKVYYILKDRTGFIWFATNSGVSKFDGTTFINFSITEGLPDNTVFGLFEDSKGRMWVYSSNGKAAF